MCPEPDTAALFRLSGEAGQRPPALAVRHARLFDPETGTVRPDTTIVVAGNRVVAAIGPRLVLAGFIDGPGPYAGPTKVWVDTEADARAWVNRYADLGYRRSSSTARSSPS